MRRRAARTSARDRVRGEPIAFDLERMNTREVYLNDTSPKEANGFRDITMNEMPRPNPHTLILGIKP